MKIKNIAYCCSFFVTLTSSAGILNPFVAVQDYRDFAENLGKYTVGTTNIPVYKTDGSLAGYLEFPMPDFSSVASLGYATLVSPSYIVSVKHNSGYKNVTFGNGAQYAATYTLINRNEYSTQDFHAPRLNKVVTDAAPSDTVTQSDFVSNRSRYQWYTRVGAGAQSQVNEEGTKRVSLSGAYNWKTGGTISKTSLLSVTNSNRLRYYNLGPDDPNTTLLSIGTSGGDSGSPVFAWDEIDQQWKLVAVHMGYDQDIGIYQKRAVAGYIPDDFIASIQQANTSPDVTDSSADGIIYWGDTAITQADHSWSWQGLAEQYNSLAPANATNDELDATKDLRFNGDGGVITLEDAVNLGAGKLQFSADYTLKSADGVNATWVGGGVEVDAGKEVLWQVNGLADDALHKIGDGTLHINATGINEGSLNTGAGTVILDQQADASGQKQAFSSVTLVSGRPTVVLADAQQVSTDNIFFGYRGGTLDLNGNALSFKKINHTDSGATLVNHNSEEAATLTLAGYGDEDVTFNRWASSGTGNIGDIYKYGNPYSKQAEYFQLLTSSYGGYPINQTSTDIWQYLGTDREVAADLVLSQLNQQVFRGFIGETDSDKTNGKLDVNVDISGTNAKMALTGGMNLNGNLNIEQGLVLLSGQPTAHAAGVVVDDDWATSYFKANQIVVNKDTTFQVGEYAQVTAEVIAGESSHLMFGYNNSTTEADKIWRCYSVIYSDTVSCSQPERSEQQQSTLPSSAVTGDVSLANAASLYLGKVDYQGSITSTGSTSVTLDSSADWTMTGNSNITTLNALSGSHLSMLPSGSWSAKQLEVDTLNATAMTLSLGVKPETAESDKLTIKTSATGDSNILDVSLLLDTSQSVTLLDDVVMIDAPSGTPHDYFTLPDIAMGFSLYTPNYAVEENNDRVLWVLQHNAEPEPEVVPDITPDEPEVTPDVPDSEPDEAEPVVETPDTPDLIEETTVVATPDTPEKAADASAVETEETPDETSTTEDTSQTQQEFSPDDWFTIQDNKPLIRNTRALMASRQYIFSEALSQLNSRASLLRHQPEKSGQWVTIEQNKGGYKGFDVTQQTLSLGWDTVRDQQMFGFNASHTQGKTKGPGQATHRMTTIGVDYSWSSPTGWFVDAASRYMHLNQEFSFDPLLAIHGASPNTHIVAGSVKSGYAFTNSDKTLTLSPYVGISGGYLSGYSVQSEEAKIALSSSTPYAAIAGLEVKKQAFWSRNPNVMLTAGIEYQYSPGRSGSELTLADSHSHRTFSALSDNRYRAQLGIEGKISDNWSVNAKVKTSFGGTFHTDYSGVAGLTWHF
ncbi:S6 family peptidase [Erwinia endophytica]|uniref:S6 family peptidase n=1 Tax=Erwinia endophytica TaxID=1563158 RepID=UPI00186B5A25|nr:S6 family peptidase [Erwinia endophytica]